MSTASRPAADDIPDLAGTLDAFAAAWTTLARLLAAAPAQDVIDAVRAPEMLEQWPLGTERAANRRGVRLLTRSHEQAEEERDVRRDFQRLYTGPGHLLAPPYESVHLGSSGQVFDQETLAVREFYRRFGLQAPRLNKDPDDHIALELELLATLAARALDALDAHHAAAVESTGDDSLREAGGLPEQVTRFVAGIGEFLDTHALPWHRRLGELSAEHAQTSFVQGLGMLLVGTTDASADVFAAPIEDDADRP